MFGKLILAVVFLIVGITLLLGLAPSIHVLSATGANQALANVSDIAKFLYGLIDFLWAVLPIVLIAGSVMLFYSLAKDITG